ncbi:MAG: dihydrolipoyl dehydrogenase [Candidatus Omnitrophica bacterium]|nr:dihydrolipoyl dehydrogenase [Candidatus Omnitrophota bacterium]
MSEIKTQLLVIGAGPGGYAAAFYAADSGMEVTLVDTELHPGGVCLYRGCIPSKALLHAAKVVSESRDAKKFGIVFNEPAIDVDKLRSWKNDIVSKMTGNLGLLAKSRKVTFIQGKATFVDSNTVKVKRPDSSSQNVRFEYAILATGSRPILLPNVPDSPLILNSTTGLELQTIPSSLLVVGGGYIGLELGTVYAELGSEVSVVEMTPGLLPGADRDLVNVLEKRLKTIFKSIMLGTKVAKVETTAKNVKVTFENPDGKTSQQTYDKILIAIGRKPNSSDLGLENAKVKVTPKGFVQVDLQRRTTDSAIFAIGDVAGEPMLAHKASHEGRVAVDAIAGKKTAFEPKAIPAVVFIDPEIAWCGLTETQARQENRAITVAKFPWGASGRAMTLNRTDGLTKLILDTDTQRVLGMAIVGPGAGELIAEGVLAVEMGAVAEDVKLAIHPHPTTSETIMEAAESFFGHATHIYRPRKEAKK